MEVDRNGEAEEVVVKKGAPRQKKIFEGIQKAKDEFASEFGYLFIEFIEKYVRIYRVFFFLQDFFRKREYFNILTRLLYKTI